MLLHPSVIASGWVLVLILACTSFAQRPVHAADCGSIGAPHTAGGELDDRDGYMGIKLRGSLHLRNTSCKSLPLMGLSGLAWSADTGILYALSDRAHIFHLEPTWHDSKLIEVTIVDAYPLRNEADEPLGIEAGDSEGLAVLRGDNGIRGDETLLVSFERQPRISRYRPYGLWLGDEPLPAVLTDISNYHSANSALESVVMHPELGLLTAPQLPLKTTADDNFRIYDRHGVLATLTPTNRNYGTLTDMALTPAGNVLVLERIFSGVFGITAAVIHQLDPRDSSQPATTIVRLDRDAGHAIDNFEGLAHHEANRYFMVSDDNGFALQQTLLFYFEVQPDQN